MKKQLNNDQLRQGDVLLVRTGDTNAPVQTSVADVVLRYGEVTGHAHRFRHERGPLLPELVRGGAALNVPVPSLLEHEEHSAAEVPVGLYDLPVQCEWDDSMEPRAVAD